MVSGMDICASHTTALQLLRAARRGDEHVAFSSPDASLPVSSCAEDIRTFTALLAESFGEQSAPPDILISDARKRPTTDGVRIHVLKRPFSRSAFLTLSLVVPDGAAQSICCCRPALLLVQYAEILLEQTRNNKLRKDVALIQLFELVMELCGTYARDPLVPRGGPCAFGISPIASKEGLLHDLQDLGYLAGIRLAQRAVALAQDGAASPMETLHYGMMCLPSKLGSLAIEPAQLNKPLALNRSQAQLANYREIKPDLGWESMGIAIEHQGGAWHGHGTELDVDANRMQDYQAHGWMVFPVTSAHTRTLEGYDKFALRVVSAMSKRGKPSVGWRVRALLRDDEFMAARRLLFAELSPPVRW